MLNLLIVDDEEIIANSIAETIDWNALGITLAGVCLDGVDAYHTILDEYPNIVITDIRMPGISGLELIQRVSRMKLPIKFIVFSGYGEFEYAKQAMKSGVRHYLLKPCNPEEITEAVRDTVQEYYADTQLQNLFPNTGGIGKDLQNMLIQNILTDGIIRGTGNSSLFSSYAPYLALQSVHYTCCTLSPMTANRNMSLYGRICRFMEHYSREQPACILQVSDKLLLLYPAEALPCNQMDSGMDKIVSQGYAASWEYQHYPNLQNLLQDLIDRLRNYDMVYFLQRDQLIPIFNFHTLRIQAGNLIRKLCSGEDADTAKVQLQKMLHSITDRNFLMQTVSQMLIDIGNEIGIWTPEEIYNYLTQLSQYSDCSKICSSVEEKLFAISAGDQDRTSYSPFIERVLQYIHEHLGDDNLSLKEIAENHLYMNANYVSRCFYKETHQKFSSYLMELRVEKAKQILASQDDARIQNVAELVGCGNNPCYFSRIFKKSTGMTPTAYVRKARPSNGLRSVPEQIKADSQANELQQQE